jgi:hypothetical protein
VTKTLPFLPPDAGFPAAIVLFGLAMILFPSFFRGQAERKHAQRLAERMERGTDAYFEELRSLQAYTPVRSRLIYQGLGAAALAVGAPDLFKLFVN